MQLFAEVVRAHAPVTHILGRMGGDEFVLLLNGPPAEERDKAAPLPECAPILQRDGQS